MNKDDPAFPHERVIVSDGYVQSKEHLSGLTKREYFAAMAMQGFLSEFQAHFTSTNADSDAHVIGVISKKSVIAADMLLEALEKKE